MPEIRYIRLTRFVTLNQFRSLDAEIQLDGTSLVPPEPGMTALRVNGWERGNPFTGDAMMDVTQLKELRAALDDRIRELEGTEETARG